MHMYILYEIIQNLPAYTGFHIFSKFEAYHKSAQLDCPVNKTWCIIKASVSGDFLIDIWQTMRRTAHKFWAQFTTNLNDWL